MIKVCKIILVGIVALFFTLVTFNNITDYYTNFEFVRHVLSMDTIHPNSHTTWHAVTSPVLHHSLYILIILWQGMTAFVCWLGTMRLALYRYKANRFTDSKNIAIVGLTMGFALYALGFIVIGGEFFQMWQSPVWNGQNTAHIFINLIGLVMIILLLPEANETD